jgi:hypothetical protein
MNPDQEIIYHTMTAILEKLRTLESAIKDSNKLLEAEGLTLKDIAEMKKVSVSSLYRKPWLLPFGLPEYSDNPIVYSRRQVIEHERMISEKGMHEIRRIWMYKNRSKRRAG